MGVGPYSAHCYVVQAPQLTISASVGEPVELELSLKKLDLEIQICSKFKQLTVLAKFIRGTEDLRTAFTRI